MVRGKWGSSLWSCCCGRRSSRVRSCWSSSSSESSSLEQKFVEEDRVHLSDDLSAIQTKPGWKAMPYILGNETMERLATYGLTANFMVYLMREFQMDQVVAANILNIWSAASNFATIIGALIADNYLGKFQTIALGSFASLTGMVIVTLIAWMPQLRPPPCIASLGPCIGYTKAQLGLLLVGLSGLAIGTGGIRPCSIPFGIDQFDVTTVEGRKGTNSFYNWYYTTQTVILLINQTLVVYIQDSVSWSLGFGIPTVLMFCAIVLLFAGTKIYVHVKPEGTTFSGIMQVFIAAYKKRRLRLPANGEVVGIFYDSPVPDQESVASKLPLTEELRFLNKAALIADKEVKPDGSCTNPWKLCSIQKVEEVKCLVKIVPIWTSCVINFISMSQQGTFIVSQALKMDRNLGPNFQIPAGSLSIISLITIGIWLPFYDRILQPAIAKYTKREEGLTTLQRIGFGNVFSILTMVVSGLVEKQRRVLACDSAGPDGVAPMSVMWLAPQQILMGLCQVFNTVALIEFYNKQFPENMRSIGTSLFYLTSAGASYLSSLVVNIVHNVTSKDGQPDWLTNDINVGRLDYFYFLIAGLAALNLVYFLFCAHHYRYKASVIKVEAESRF